MQAAKTKDLNPLDFVAAEEHRTLFSTRDTALLVFADFDALSEANFLALIANSAPRLIFDLRVAPRFDTGSLNRKLVFSMFQNVGAKYFDVSAVIGLTRTKNIWSGAANLVMALHEVGLRSSPPVEGPILFLADPASLNTAVIDAIAADLAPLNPRGWSTLRFPEFVSASALGTRQTIFISHATPDDNDFARWLGGQLALAGYDIWVDFDRLKGGETFWDTIEDVIRHRAARVIVVASRLGQTRNGVLDEINLAISIERSLNIEGFVIPLRTDDLPYADFRANIARKNIINFDGNWAVGLTHLLQTLEAANIRRSAEVPDASIIFQDRIDNSSHLVDADDKLLLNWLPVVGLPEKVYFHQMTGPAGKLSAIAKTLSVPNVHYGNSIVAFSSQLTIPEASRPGVRTAISIAVATRDLEQGNVSSYPNIRASEGRKIISNLLRQGWDNFARSRGLKAYVLSSRAVAYYAADGRIKGNKVQFQSFDGVKRRKSLVGYSKKRSVFWHFALELKIAPGSPLRFIAKAHVVFSNDGNTPIVNDAKMHALRRGFCKTWWNDRWRDLTEAFLSWLADGQDQLALAVGSDTPVLLCSHMINAICPVRPLEAEAELISIDDDATDDPEDVELDIEEVVELSEINDPNMVNDP